MKEPFIEIYDRFFSDIYRYVYMKLGNKWDTDDIVSDIFRKAFERYASLQEQSSAKAWLITIARNTIIDFYRKKKDTFIGEGMDRLIQPFSFEEQVELKEDMECLQKALSSLSEEDQELIQLRYFAELKYKEMTEIAGKSEETIKTRVYRIIKKLGVLVKQCLEGEKIGG